MWTCAAGSAVALLALTVAASAATAPRSPVWGAPVKAGELPADASEAVEVLTVDLNGDGLTDAVVGPVNGAEEHTVVPAPPVFLLNDGGGRFTDATAKLFGGPAPEIEWDRELLSADFNRDGRPDIFVADHGHVDDTLGSASPRNGAQQHLFLSTGGSGLVDASGNLPQQRTFTHSAAVGDVNGDGAPDVVENNLGCCTAAHVQAQVLLNDGSGRFTVEPDGIHGMITDVYGNDHSYACLLADVNGDGALDLVLGGSEEQGANASQVLLGDGHGHFTFFETLPPTIGPADNAFVIDVKAADVNGDGAVDLVFAETLNDPWYVGTNIQVLVNDGHGRFADESSTRLPAPPHAQSWPQRVLLQDVNDDGRPDLTIQYAPAGAAPQADPTVLYLNDGGVFRPATAPKDGFGAGGGGIGWVNGDGPHALFSVESHPLGQSSSYYVTPELVQPVVHVLRTGRSEKLTWTAVAGAARYDIRRNGKLIATTVRTSYVDRSPGARPRYSVSSRP